MMDKHCFEEEAVNTVRARSLISRYIHDDIVNFLMRKGNGKGGQTFNHMNKFIKIEA